MRPIDLAVKYGVSIRTVYLRMNALKIECERFGRRATLAPRDVALIEASLRTQPVRPAYDRLAAVPA